MKGSLKVSDRELCSYGGSILNVVGKKCISMSCKGQTADVCVYIVEQGPLMGLDMMRVFEVNIVDNRVCAVSS